MADSVLARFCPPVAEWFRGVFAAPTPVQQEAWEAISAGEHALVVAPTGSGKTLAAFFVGIEFLWCRHRGSYRLSTPLLPRRRHARALVCGFCMCRP